MANIAIKNEIVKLHNEVDEAVKIVILKAVRIGELLTEKKASLAHGEFGKWITDNLPFKVRTAQMYMKAFNHKTEIEAGKITSLHQLNEKNAEPAHLTTTELLTLILQTGEVDKWNDESQKQFTDEINMLTSVMSSKNPTVLDLMTVTFLKRKMIVLHGQMIYLAYRIGLIPTTTEKHTVNGKWSEVTMPTEEHYKFIDWLKVNKPERNFPQFNF